MRIGLIDVDGKNFPNIALMKISAYHKEKGDTVEWYSPWEGYYDEVYMAKVFSFTPDYDCPINAGIVHKGGGRILHRTYKRQGSLSQGEKRISPL